VRRPRRPRSQTWRTFLTNHTAALGSIDFFTVQTITGRVLFVFVVLLHDRRRVVHFNIIGHPTAAWTAQQIIDAFPHETAPSWVLRDRDATYGEAFRQRLAGMGIGEVLSSPSSPWQNPFAERLIGSIRRDCLNHVVVFGEQHLRRDVHEYNRALPHSAFRGQTPDEMYFRRGDAVPANLAARAAAARRARVEANRSAACGRCPSIGAAA
jgi:transposase InsO family protein